MILMGEGLAIITQYQSSPHTVICRIETDPEGAL